MQRSHPYPIQVQGRSTEEIKAAEDRKRKEQEEKKLQKVAAPKQKKYYDIRLDALVPCTITYRVYADDEHDALNELKKKAPSSVKPNISQKRDIKAMIYDAGSSILRLTKTFRF
jgi:hypothetical protein